MVLSAAFQLNVCCFSAGQPFLDIMCTYLGVSTGFSASLNAIIAVLAASVTAFVIPMSCFVQLQFYFFYFCFLPLFPFLQLPPGSLSFSNT